MAKLAAEPDYFSNQPLVIDNVESSASFVCFAAL